MINVVEAINKMQRNLGRTEIETLNDNWIVFYEENEKNECKGLCILFLYQRLTCEPDYMTGKVAEVEIYTFDEYRRQGVSTRLLKQAIDYAKDNKIDLVADCVPNGYATMTKVGFVDSADKRVWCKCSE